MTARLSPAELARQLGDGWDPASVTVTAPDGPPEGGRSVEAVWAVLATVPDPEIPVVSVVDLGIVRRVDLTNDGAVSVTITPTYSGCPAMREIEREIVAALRAHGWQDVRIALVYAPAWSTDWMSDATREKLRAYGIAPPGGASASAPLLVPLRRRGADATNRPPLPVACPRCGSTDTRLVSSFGSTACKALHTCEACRQPFEEMKPF